MNAFRQRILVVMSMITALLVLSACDRPPTVILKPLPASVQAGTTYVLEADIVGKYTDTKFSTDNGLITKTTTSNKVAYWTPVESGKPAIAKIEVSYSGGSTPVEAMVTVSSVTKAPEPACPSTLTVSTPQADSTVGHNLRVQLETAGLVEGVRLRLATWPHLSNNYHPQEVKPDGESWTGTVYVGISETESIGEKFDLVVLAVNAAGDFRIDQFIATAKRTNAWTGMSTIEGARECLRIERLTRD